MFNLNNPDGPLPFIRKHRGERFPSMCTVERIASFRIELGHQFHE
jgi:hypothetical protein